jgi:hypothetical protein
MVRIAPFAAVVLAIALPASAQTLYKLIGKDGKVTYSEEKPKDFDGQVVPMQINPEANTATLPKYQPRAAPSSAPAAKEADAKAESPQEKLERAKKALQDAKDNPREGDLDRMGIKGGGTRPVPSEAYLKRLAELEKAVKDAEEEVRRAR